MAVYPRLKIFPLVWGKVWGNSGFLRKRGYDFHRNLLILLVRPARFELATYGFVVYFLASHWPSRDFIKLHHY